MPAPRIADCLPDYVLYAAAFAAALPLGWLVALWSDGASQSLLVWSLTVALGVSMWRLVGEQAPGSSANRGYVLNLLICGAVLRGAGRAARLEPCAGAGSRLDAYALAVLAGTHPRARPWPPHRLALLNTLWLPTEVVLQRTLSASLQPILVS